MLVSKLFRAYGLYNWQKESNMINLTVMFQSSFELTGYITIYCLGDYIVTYEVSKLFRAYGLYNPIASVMFSMDIKLVSKLFRAYGLYNN